VNLFVFLKLHSPFPRQENQEGSNEKDDDREDDGDQKDNRDNKESPVSWSRAESDFGIVIEIAIEIVVNDQDFLRRGSAISVRTQHHLNVDVLAFGIFVGADDGRSIDREVSLVEIDSPLAIHFERLGERNNIPNWLAIEARLIIQLQFVHVEAKDQQRIGNVGISSIILDLDVEFEGGVRQRPCVRIQDWNIGVEPHAVDHVSHVGGFGRRAVHWNFDRARIGVRLRKIDVPTGGHERRTCHGNRFHGAVGGPNALNDVIQRDLVSLLRIGRQNKTHNG